MHEFIALRKTPRPPTRELGLGLATLSTADKRLRFIEDAETSERAMVIERDVGLQQIRPEEQVAEVEHGFQRLGLIGAYLVNAPDEQTTEQAREKLEPDYYIVPNIELSLPTPTLAAGHLLRRGDQRESWPAESGVGAAHGNGVTGKGVLVGVLDTGCDADHLELRRKHIEFRYVSPLSPHLSTMRAVRGFDTSGHGTHVCGILAGQRVGVAPDADLMVASVIESESPKTSLKRLAIALDWMLSQFRLAENQDKPTIVSMSLGISHDSISALGLQTVINGLRSLLSTLVEDFDVLPVIAIGNEGPGTVRAPAYFPEALSVGAVDFGLSPYHRSGGGTSPITGDPEPAIAGYGVEVFSSLDRDAANRSWYARMSGTSMATPYVTGIAALFASANPGLQGKALRHHILSQALPLGEPPNRVGVGLARFV